MQATVFIQDVFNITGLGVVPVGEVKTGTLRRGMRATINGKVAVLKTIEMHHEQLEEAHPGDNIGMEVDGIKKDDLVKGMEVTFSDEETIPPSTAASNTTSTKPEPIRPKGFLSWLFRR